MDIYNTTYEYYVEVARTTYDHGMLVVTIISYYEKHYFVLQIIFRPDWSNKNDVTKINLRILPKKYVGTDF